MKVPCSCITTQSILIAYSNSCVSLLDRITGIPRDTLVALDLGGGSTQITFVPVEGETMSSTPADYLTSISLLRKNLNLYTHRWDYLCISWRIAVLQDIHNIYLWQYKCKKIFRFMLEGHFHGIYSKLYCFLANCICHRNVSQSCSLLHQVCILGN